MPAFLLLRCLSDQESSKVVGPHSAKGPKPPAVSARGLIRLSKNEGRGLYDPRPSRFLVIADRDIAGPRYRRPPGRRLVAHVHAGHIRHHLGKEFHGPVRDIMVVHRLA